MANPKYVVSVQDDDDASTDTQDNSQDRPDSSTDADSKTSDSTSEAQDTDTKTSSGISEDVAGRLKQDITKDVTDSVSKTVSQSVVDKIAKALGLTKEESEEELPNDPKKLQEYINKQVSSAFKERQDAEKQQEEQTQEQRQQQIQTIITSWHGQYNNLARMGKVPEIKDANDKNDPGIVARRKIIQEIGNMIDENKKSGDSGVANYTPTVQDAILKNPSLVRGVPGANLPISGNTSSREDGSSFSNKEIRDKSFIELAAESAL